MGNEQKPDFNPLHSVSETLSSELEPRWAARRHQRIYLEDSHICSVDQYVVDLNGIGNKHKAVADALNRRSTTAPFSAFLRDREDVGFEYLLDLYGITDNEQFTTLVFLDRIKASEMFYAEPKIQRSIFAEIGRDTKGAGLLCCAPTEQSFLDLDGDRPQSAPFTDSTMGANPRPRVMDADLVFSQNYFSFLFEIGKDANGKRTKPLPPVFLRPFKDRVSLKIENYPTTNMPGSKFLLGSELPGPRGVFISKASFN